MAKTKETNSIIEQLKKDGIGLKTVFFNKTVTSSSGEPEFRFFSEGMGQSRPSRVAKLWYTPSGILIEQKDKHKLVPLANVLESELL